MEKSIMARETKTRKKATRRAASRKPKQPRAVSEAERRRLIAERAYSIAERRSFAGGDPRDDWLQAEAEINRELGLGSEETEPSAGQRKKEIAAYEKLREDIEHIFSDMRESVAVSNESVKRAFDEAAQRLRKARKYSAETIEKALAAAQKDLADAAHKIGPKWGEISEKSAGLLEVWRDRSAAFMNHAAGAVSDWLQQVGGVLGRQTYRTGEMMYRGTLECRQCGERLSFDKAAHVPPCPKCGHKEFRRA
jgi:DNA-directed RNA polymerase subunit RPC12/RpoP